MMVSVSFRSIRILIGPHNTPPELNGTRSNINWAEVNTYPVIPGVVVNPSTYYASYHPTNAAVSPVCLSTNLGPGFVASRDTMTSIFVFRGISSCTRQDDLKSSARPLICSARRTTQARELQPHRSRIPSGLLRPRTPFRSANSQSSHLLIWVLRRRRENLRHRASSF
jgi:hypothetical protein